MTTKPHEQVWEDADHSGETVDAWHRHTAEEGRPQAAHGQTTPGAIALVGVGSFVALVLTIGFVTVFFGQVNVQQREEKIEIDLGANTRQLKAEWKAELGGYGWVDPAKGLVYVPIDQAMDRVISEYGKPAQ